MFHMANNGCLAQLSLVGTIFLVVPGSSDRCNAMAVAQRGPQPTLFPANLSCAYSANASMYYKHAQNKESRRVDYAMNTGVPTRATVRHKAKQQLDRPRHGHNRLGFKGKR